MPAKTVICIRYGTILTPLDGTIEPCQSCGHACHLSKTTRALLGDTFLVLCTACYKEVSKPDDVFTPPSEEQLKELGVDLTPEQARDVMKYFLGRFYGDKENT